MRWPCARRIRPNAATFNEELLHRLIWHDTEGPHLCLRYFQESFARDSAQSQMLWTSAPSLPPSPPLC